MPNEARPCHRCGMAIEFLEGPNGRTIPAQKIRVVYYLTDEGKLAKEEHPEDGLPLPDRYVSHFETCPYASEFSKRKKG